jgi:hypothetical protein
LDEFGVEDLGEYREHRGIRRQGHDKGRYEATPKETGYGKPSGFAPEAVLVMQEPSPRKNVESP